MRSVQELIATGRVPADTKTADGTNAYPAGWPIFTQLKDQVKYDWDYLPSDRVRILRADPTYKAALVEMLEPPESAAPAPAADAAVVPPAPAGPSLEEEIQGTVTPPVTAEAVIEEPVIPVPVAAAPGEDAVGTRYDIEYGYVTKTAEGWEVHVTAGGGEQVFKARTQTELILVMAKAQAHASAKIRSQEEERLAILNAEPDPIVVRKRLAPRALTADEQFEIAEALSSGDATKVTKALAKRDQILLGGSIEEVVGQVNETQDQLEYQGHVNTAKAFIKQHPEYSFSKEYGERMDAILAEKSWGYTVRNLNKVLAILESQGDFPDKVSAAAEPPIPVPTSASAAAPAAAPTVQPAALPPAPRPAPPAQTPEAQALRLRPGSASTGMSPRQASVRPGATPPAPSVVLTAEEYNRMSVSDTRRKYKTDLGFRAAVDKLIAEGKI